MTEIERILTMGKSARADVFLPSDREISAIERELGFCFPASYREFVRLGGLGELRINHRVLPPSEILIRFRGLPDGERVPFADNGCGDLYCWPRTGEEEPCVVFADHETSYNCSEVSPSFTEWLEASRF